MVDEANIEYGGETSLPLLNSYSNLIIVKTFSKAYGLAGLRVGYAFFGDKELREKLDASRSPFMISSLSELLVLQALKDDEHVKNSCDFMKEQREFLISELRNLDFFVINSVSNCFIASLPRGLKVLDLLCYLNQNSCNITPGKHFGLDERFIRVAPQTKEVNCCFLELCRQWIKNEKYH